MAKTVGTCTCGRGIEAGQSFCAGCGARIKFVYTNHKSDRSRKIAGWTFAGVVASLTVWAIMAGPADPAPRQSGAASYDSCKASEADVRQFWVIAAGMHAKKMPDGRRDEADATRIAADLVRQSENLCRERRDARPTLLPAELQRLVR